MNSDLPGVSDLIENGIPHGCNSILIPARLAIGKNVLKNYLVIKNLLMRDRLNMLSIHLIQHSEIH